MQYEIIITNNNFILSFFISKLNRIITYTNKNKSPSPIFFIYKFTLQIKAYHVNEKSYFHIFRKSFQKHPNF